VTRRWLPWVTGTFAAFILYIIVCADRGTMPAWTQIIYKLPGQDRLGHVLLIGTLGLLLNLAFPRRAVLVTVVLAWLVTAEEISQLWFPTRSFDLLDLAADFIGILVAYWLARQWPVDSRRSPAK
jgi:VanZ family protein